MAPLRVEIAIPVLSIWIAIATVIATGIIIFHNIRIKGLEAQMKDQIFTTDCLDKRMTKKEYPAFIRESYLPAYKQKAKKKGRVK